MTALCLVGILLSATVVVGGYYSRLMILLMLALYFSVVTIASAGTPFYHYGWESLLSEDGFVVMLLCGLPCLSQSTATTTTTESHVSPTDGDDTNTNNDTDCVVEERSVWRWRNIVWEDKERPRCRCWFCGCIGG